VKVLLQQRYDYALDMLKKHEGALHRVADALVEREQLDGKEIALVIEGGKLPPLHSA
jgi:cell division protease FtsH